MRSLALVRTQHHKAVLITPIFTSNGIIVPNSVLTVAGGPRHPRTTVLSSVEHCSPGVNSTLLRTFFQCLHRRSTVPVSTVPSIRSNILVIVGVDMPARTVAEAAVSVWPKISSPRGSRIAAPRCVRDGKEPHETQQIHRVCRVHLRRIRRRGPQQQTRERRPKLRSLTPAQFYLF